MDIQKQYDARLKRVMDAVSLKEPDRVPPCTGVSGVSYLLCKHLHHKGCDGGLWKSGAGL